MAGDLVISTINGGAIGAKNAIINGNFGINQRGVSGTVTLSAGAYGHDRFKAGAGGCTYTFATSNNVTTLTITAGSLMQVIEGINLQSGTYTLSWTGTAQGRVDAGSYAGSGLTGTAVGGTNQTVEFGTGTLSLVQYEAGSTATLFEHRQYGQELALCQRYYENNYPTGTAVGAVVGDSPSFGLAYRSGTATPYFVMIMQQRKRATPTFTVWNGVTGASGTWRGSGSSNESTTISGNEVSFTATTGSSDSLIRSAFYEANSEL